MKHLIMPAAALLFFILVTAAPLYAQNKIIPAYQVKAAFLYNFTRFIDWPDVAFKSSKAPFVIGIAGKDPFGHYLQDIVRDEKVGGHPIVVRQFVNVVKDMVDCHMLFINLDDPAGIKEVLSAVNNQAVLTVSEADTFSQWGGIINFFKEGNKIRIQINVNTAKAAQLNLSSKLLGVAKIFDPPVN